MSTTKEEALELLTPYICTLKNCVNGGFQDYKSLDPAITSTLEIRTKANLIRDRTVAHIQEQFYQNPNIRIIKNRGLFLIQIENKIRVRFHKLNSELTISSGKTKRSKLYLNQEELFPEIQSEVTNLVAGYRVDSTWDSISFFISCPNGNVVSWVLDSKMFEQSREPDFILEEPIPVTTGRVKIKQNILKEVVNYGKNC